MIKSPLTRTTDVVHIQRIAVKDIVIKYINTFNIDVSKYFDELEFIDIYKCIKTGYQFYYPFNIEGDSEFYEHFQQYDWYYMPWKWEHQQVLNYIDDDMHVLELGCANGDFLQKILNINDVNVTGLELNESINNTSVNILYESIEVHSKNNADTYDIVCSFQVLEHISDVYSFLYAQYNVLKKGGNLIISVPNNQSFIKFNKHDDILNMPPHHLGLWDKYSLNQISKLFNMKVVDLKFEPLQSYHLQYYINIFEKRLKRKRLLRIFYYRFKFKSIYRFYVKLFRKFIKGHTVLIVFKKL